MFEEQPIPLTRRTFHGGSWRTCRARVRADRTAKSPHPGHQSGLVSDLYCWSSSAMLHHLEGPSDDLARPERLPVVLREQVVDLASRLRAEEACELARVVRFDHERHLERLEDLLDLRDPHGEEVRELEAVHPVPLRGESANRLAHGRGGGTPRDDREVRVRRAPQLREGHLRPQPLELPHPFFHHLTALL